MSAGDVIPKLWLDDVRPAPSDAWLHVRTVDAAINVLRRSEVIFASLDHDLGYTGPLPGSCEECGGSGRVNDLPCVACDGDGFVGGDVLYIAAHAEKDGIVLVEWMCEEKIAPTEGIRIHSWNPSGALKMATTFRTAFPDLPCVVEEYRITRGW